MLRYIAICDDESSVRAQLRACLNLFAQSHGDTLQITEFDSGENLLAHFSEQTDILFLDIRMDGLNGIETAKKLRKISKNLCIVFITSLIEYALDGYDVHAYGFLQKPIDSSQLFKCFSDALKMIDTRSSSIVLKGECDNEKILISDIYYAEVQGHNVCIKTEGKKALYSASMKTLESRLLSSGFFRCHSGYLVNMHKIRSYNNTELVLLNNECIPLSRHRKNDFIRAFTELNGGLLR